MSTDTHWFFHICSIAVIGCMVLGISRQESKEVEIENRAVEEVETKSLWEPDAIPHWERDWQNTDTYSGPNAKKFIHTRDCEDFFSDPESSYELYVTLDSIGTREQHDKFFKSHCVGEYK